MLWLALTAAKFGKLPSELADIQDDIAALDFNLACGYRLELHEMEKAKTNAKLIAYEVSKLFGDGSDDDGDIDTSGAEVW